METEYEALRAALEDRADACGELVGSLSRERAEALRVAARRLLRECVYRVRPRDAQALRQERGAAPAEGGQE